MTYIEQVVSDVLIVIGLMLAIALISYLAWQLNPYLHDILDPVAKLIAKVFFWGIK